MSRLQIPVVGVIGSIGSGKSSIAAGVADCLQGVRIDADRIGHEVLRHADIQSALIEEFGAGIRQDCGEIDRQKLAKLVFGTGGAEQARRRLLEAIVHPRIQAEIVREIEDLEQRGGCGIIVLDAAVLLEAGWQHQCDAIICVDADRAKRVGRVARRGWGEQELANREASQWMLDEKQRVADFHVDNSHELSRSVDAVVDFLVHRFPGLSALDSTQQTLEQQAGGQTTGEQKTGIRETATPVKSMEVGVSSQALH